uniref:CCHC-type domain-containing protein n=1 Tax=Trichuris muris TaxID=70415 RepID=A0A5S6QRW1_TRIMR
MTSSWPSCDDWYIWPAAHPKAGLPERVQDTLRSGVRMEDLNLGELLTRARAILTKDYTDYERDTGMAADQSSTYFSRTHGDSAIRCYACGGSNHFARECPTRRRDSAAIRRSEYLNRQAHRRDRGRNLAGPIAPLYQGNEEREVSAPAFSQLTAALPTVEMEVNGVRRHVFIDTGCTRCIIHVPCCKEWRKQEVTVTTESGGCCSTQRTYVLWAV